MTRIEGLLHDYRVTKARYAYLRARLDMLAEVLSKCEAEMVSDCMSMSQAITGMPHGSSVGDPTCRLAIDIASGKKSEFVKQIQAEIDDTQREAARLMEDLRVADIVISSMTDREREVVELKIMDDRDWDDVLLEMNKRHNNSYSKRSLQRLYSRAMDKAEEVTK